MKKILLLFFLISTFAYCDQWFDSIEINNIELTKLLLKNGADINAKDENGDTALALAIKNNLSATAVFLIKNGANLKSEDINNNYLTIALENNNFKIAELLIDSGIEIIYYDNFYKNQVEYNSPLNIILDKYYSDDTDISLKPSFLSLLKKILNRDINNSSYIYTNIILNKIIDHDDKITLTLLIESGLDINFKDEDDDTLLIKACRHSSENIGKFLIENKADINAKNKNGITPLIWVAYRNNTILTNLLLSNGADVNLQDNKGRTALMWAVYAKDKDIDIINILLEYKANVNLSTIYSWTPLMQAVHRSYNENIDKVKLLIKSGADINMKNDENLTPLNIAINEKYINTMLFLIENGADIKVKDEKGNNALIKLLDFYEFSADTRESSDAENKEVNPNDILFKTAKLLIDKGLDINEKNSDGDSALSIACKNLNYKFIQFFLNNKADINTKNNLGETPLLILAEKKFLTHSELNHNNENSEYSENKNNIVNTNEIKIEKRNELNYIIEVLFLRKGADVNALDNSNNSAFYWLRKMLIIL